METSSRRSGISGALSAVIAEAISAQGLSHMAVADRTGIARSTLLRRLAGSPLTVDELARIADLLGVSPATLLRRAERAVMDGAA